MDLIVQVLVRGAWHFFFKWLFYNFYCGALILVFFFSFYILHYFTLHFLHFNILEMLNHGFRKVESNLNFKHGNYFWVLKSTL